VSNVEELSRKNRHCGRNGEHRANVIVCESCAKACDGRLCKWVKYLTEEHIPKGAEYHTNPKTGNFRITACPDFIPGRCGDGKPDDNSIKEAAHAVIKPKKEKYERPKFIAKRERPVRKADDEDLKRKAYYDWVMHIQHMGAG
jgi:hypothetical protein